MFSLYSLCIRFFQLLVAQMSVVQKIECLAEKAEIAGDSSSPVHPCEGHADAHDSSEWEMLSNEVSKSEEEETEREEEDADRGGDLEGLHANLIHMKNTVEALECLSHLILYVGMGFVVLHLWNLVTRVM